MNIISQQFKPVIQLLESNRDYYPGAAVSVLHRAGRRSRFLLHTAIGRLEPDPTSPPVTPETLFDLASLTKPIATATAILLLIQKELLRLDSRAGKFLPELENTDKEPITIAQLLTHTSGLPAWKPLYIHGGGVQRIIMEIARTPLEFKPGSIVVYSCPGYILLAEIIRRITGKTLAEFTHESIFAPLDMHRTCFNPDKKLRHSIAPTEFGNEFERILAGEAGLRYKGWRDYRLWGEVQDGNSFAADGEGGNAGLFSTLNDLSHFAEMVLDGGTWNGKTLLKPEIFQQAVTNQTKTLNLGRGLGWQMAETSLSAGTAMSRNAFGHNGFSGTSLWFDPTRRIAVTLLTNRTYYGGDGNRFAKIRAPFHDLVIQCFDRLPEAQDLRKTD